MPIAGEPLLDLSGLSEIQSAHEQTEHIGVSPTPSPGSGMLRQNARALLRRP